MTHQLNPFPGLRPFRPDEDYLFFGREEQTMELLQRLGENRFVAVVGTSGSGKSSLVRCGLLSEIQGGKLLRAGADWEIAVTHPGGDPLALLADALLEADLYDCEEDGARERLLATLSRSHFGLVEAVKQAGLGSRTNFLLVVDQFEEIFRFNEAGQAQQEAANEFVSHLLQAVEQQQIPIYVVLTMRSDFIGECSQFEGLSEMVNRGEFLIPRLTREQYKRVIEAPIKVAGGNITPRLLQRLLNDLGQQVDQLPCLQHALMRTWIVARAQDPDKALDLEDYQLIGRMSQALSLHADEVYESLADDRQRQLCAGIFQALTVQESEGRGVRRPQRLANLSQIVDAPAAELMPVIDAYRQPGITFLMPPAEVEVNESTVIDISHESLMRVWTRLRHWAEEEAQAAGIYRRLSENAVMHQRGEAGLYRDPELGIALSWRETRNPNEAWASRYHQDFAKAIAFLEESQAAAAAEEQQRAAAHQRELEQARQLAAEQRLRAEEQRRAAIRLRWLVAGLAGIAAVAVVATFLAVAAQKQAAENERIAVSAHAEAVSAAEATQVAFDNAQIARDEAQRARDEERAQREVAETQTAAAGARAQQQTELALGQAESAREEAEAATLRADESRRQADEDRKRAEEAEQLAVEGHRVAEREKLAAERSAELARRRERLFEQLLPLLREHASEGVGQYAQRLRADGRPREALDTFVDFCNLVLGEEQHGLLASELLDLDSFDLQGLDTDVISVEIAVPPRSLFSQVLMPAIELGEQLLVDGSDEELRQIVTAMHSYRVRLLKEHPREQWPANESAAEMVFHSLDRAATLDPGRYEHFLQRAGARLRRPKPDLQLALQDLNRAIELYPDPPPAVRESGETADVRRRLAQIQHSKGNVLEYLALRDRTASPAELLAEAERAHRQARSLDAGNCTYSVGVARTLRKRHSVAPAPNNLRAAEQLLNETLAADSECAVAYNELGELLILLGRVAESRTAFENAVRYGSGLARKRGLYVFYCNLANAYSRDPTDQPGFQKALEAAEQAIALQTGAAVEGHYYRGFALWKQGRIAEALAALSEVIDRSPKHLEALSARSQIVFEQSDAGDIPLQQAYSDVRSVLSVEDLTGSERAKAFYVNSLGWLRDHVRQKSESALVKCQEFSLQAAQLSGAYAAFASKIFAHAAGFAWQNGELQQQSDQLQQEYETFRLGRRTE